ncbi:MAG: type VI secretion system membrane subunit TssM, partial [Paracoccaceae bacterium]|nr:type VI secretion system membrane subunit TssM [Paracoccaceae bacterium]
IAPFDDEFSLLLTQLNAQSLERMQQETDPQRRSLIAGFPGQVASVRQVARDFLNEVFQDNKFEHRHMLRGVYFASGTQEGTPIDRLMMGMARTFGIGRQAIGSGKGTGRSYFLTRLFDQVVFREAGLVSADDKVERRYRWIRRGAITASVLVALTAATLWTLSFLGNRAMIAEATERLTAYQAAAAVIPSNPISDSDVPSVVPALNILRGMPANAALPEPAEPAPNTGWGLYQGKVIGAEGAQAYRAALNQHLLPRLLLRLEGQIQGNINSPEILYEALKVYLMLGQQGSLNPDLVTEWMNLDWNLAFPGPTREDLRTDLNNHLAALLSHPMQKVSLNGPLLDQAQELLLQMPMAQRIYNGIIASPRALELPKWRITDVGGPAVTRALVRSSGKPLNEGIEGIFTYKGFNEVFLGEALGVAKRIQSESWVLGPRGTMEQSEAGLLALSRDVLDLYYNDFIARYEGILGDVDIIPMESLSHAVEVTNVLSGPTSPIVNLLNAIATETRLTASDAPPSNLAVNQGITDVARLELQSVLSVQAKAFVGALENSAIGSGGERPKAPGVYVEERFAWL